MTTRFPWNRTIAPLLAAALMTACGTAPSTSSQPQESSSQPVRLDSSSSKVNPGCRIDLAYPLVMSAESDATDWTRWTARTMDGDPVDQTVLSGSRVNLVFIWSSYCNSSIEDLSILTEISKAYSPEDLGILCIVASAQNEDGSPRETEPLLVADLERMAGADFLQLYPSDDLIAIHLKDLDTLPESLLLDSSGNPLSEVVTGPQTAFQYRQWIDKALASLEESAPKQ